VATVIGGTIDRYRVVEKLGQGGMGVVYRARDTLLGRFVALKALPPETASDPAHRDRFLEEAKAASALQHPGIVSVYDVVRAEGQDFIVMEYVSGETLEQRMGQRALPLSRGLRYAEQVADALARAHVAGIVHRDLKPSNVMVTEDDTVKILDFGLAKLAEAPFPGDEAPTVSRGHRESPTREGAIAGTLAYMSPEQASGRPVDARTDVFSFGVLLYEMLTGRHPFRRGSSLETLSAIREADPERPSQVAPGLPPEAERAILRCLHKDPSRRWQSMSDLKAVLQDLREDSESGRARGAGAPAVAKRSRAWWWAAAAALMLAAAAGFVLYRRLAPRAGPGPLELARLTFDAGLTGDPTISADGKLVAYASDRSGEGHLDIWVQHVSEREAARLTHDPVDDWQPTLSPDGSRVAYRSERDGGGLYVVPTLGGQPRKIADGGRLPRFSPDGSQIAYLRDVGWTPRGLLPMFLVPADGGNPRPFQPDFGVPDIPGSAGPIWSPDGRHILFRGFRLEPPGEDDWRVAPVDGGPAVATGAATALPQRDAVQVPCAWFGHHVLMAAGTTMEGINLYRVRIGADFRVSGPPEPLTSGTGISHLASVSQDGHVVVPRWTGVFQLWAIDPEAKGGSAAPQAITHDAAPKFGLWLDRQGDRVAYTAFRGPQGRQQVEIRVLDLPSGEETAPVRLAPTSVSVRPRLSPDGGLLAWEGFEGGQFVAFFAKTGEPSGKELCRDCRLLGFASEGKRVLLRTGARRVALHDVSSGAETPVFEPEAGSVIDADLSWDDRWVAALTGHPDGTIAIRTVPVAGGAPPGSGAVEIARSDRWLSSPRWSPEGNRVYYLSVRDGFNCIWAQAVDPGTKAPRGEPFAVFHAHRSPWRMTAPRSAFSFSVGRHRLIFNAGEMTGSVLMARLPPD
jgi:Tol biopolymer transport system component/predicted Ser/Thr protein kinase